MKNTECWYKEVCKLKDCTCCIRFEEMKYLMDNSNIPKNKQTPISLSCDARDRNAFLELADIKDDIENFVKNGENLYITSSETGNGKTSWALKLLLKYFDTVWAGNGFNVRGYFAHIPTLLGQLKNFTDDTARVQLLSLLMRVDLVVWDDIASTKLSDFDISQLLSIIDTRLSNGLSNIYTGNIVTKEGLKSALGDRLASRIWIKDSIIELKGKDRR